MPVTSREPSKRRAILADLSLAEVHEKNAPLVHDAAQVEARAGLADDGAEDGMAEELADLVLDRGDGLGLVLRLPGGELPFPERLHDGIADPRHEHLAIRGVAEEPLEREEGGAGNFEEREEGVAEDVLQSGAPTVAVELLEGRDDAGGDKRTLLRRRGSKSGLNASGKSRSPASKRTTSFVRCGGTQSRMASAEVAMRIDEREPAAGGDIGCDELVEQRGLAHAGLADDGQVPAAVVGADAERLPGGSGTWSGRGPRGRVPAAASGSAAGGSSSGCRCGCMAGARDGGGGGMPERSEFLGGEEETAAGGDATPAL